MGHVTLITFLSMLICHPYTGTFNLACLCTEFDQSSVILSRHMVVAQQNLHSSRDLITPLSGMVCHPWASVCYDQLNYQI